MSSDDYHGRSRERDSDQEDRHRDRDRDRDRDRERDRDRDRGKDRHRERDRDYRDRDRDRDRDRERDKSRDRDSETWRERDRRERDTERRHGRSSSPEAEGRRWGEPTRIIMVKNIPLTATFEEVHAAVVASAGRSVMDVRLIKDKSTGQSRGFAFVEFVDVQEATRWITGCQGTLVFGGTPLRLEFSQPQEPRADDDWICATCSTANYRWKSACHSCGATRTGQEAKKSAAAGNPGNNTGQRDVWAIPTPMLLVRGLAEATTAQALYHVFVAYGKHVRDVRMVRTKSHASCGYAFVEFYSVEDASAVFALIPDGRVAIDGATVTVTFANTNSFSAPKSASGVAAAAIAAAQWAAGGGPPGAPVYWDSHLYADSIQAYIQSQYQQPGMVLPSAYTMPSYAPQQQPAAVEQTYPAPELKTDGTSGYTYEAHTGYYYDPASQYFFDSTNARYLYYDTHRGTYVQAADQQQGGAAGPTAVAVASTPSTESAQGKASKEEPAAQQPVQAHKIAEDLKKWERQQERERKKRARAEKQARATAAPTEAAAADTPAPLPATVSASESEDQHRPDPNALAAGLPIAGDPAQQDEATVAQLRAEAIEEVHREMVRWDELTCLLCNRKLKSRDLLAKHVALSALHLGNLEPKVQELLSLLDQQNSGSGSQYRDRAKERRQMHNQPDRPVAPPKKWVPPPSTKKVGAITSYEQPTALGLGADNKGSQLLKKMGWTEGMGLGSKGQGITAPIQATMHAHGAGLGSMGGAFTPETGDTYKEALLNYTRSRYNAMQDPE